MVQTAELQQYSAGYNLIRATDFDISSDLCLVAALCTRYLSPFVQNYDFSSCLLILRLPVHTSKEMSYWAFFPFLEELVWTYYSHVHNLIMLFFHSFFFFRTISICFLTVFKRKFLF